MTGSIFFFSICFSIDRCCYLGKKVSPAPQPPLTRTQTQAYTYTQFWNTCFFYSKKARTLVPHNLTLSHTRAVGQGREAEEDLLMGRLAWRGRYRQKFSKVSILFLGGGGFVYEETRATWQVHAEIIENRRFFSKYVCKWPTGEIASHTCILLLITIGFIVCLQQMTHWRNQHWEHFFVGRNLKVLKVLQLECPSTKPP